MKPNDLIDRLPDGLYWKLRHTALFLLNLPFMPVNAMYWVIREVIHWGVMCFTCDGSEQIEPFWHWKWRNEE